LLWSQRDGQWKNQLEEGEVFMASRVSTLRSHSSSDYWPPELSDEPADLDGGSGRRARQPPRRRRGLRTLLTFCIGIAATLGWQSYGDAAREMIANMSPQLGWLAPQAVAATPAAPEPAAPAVPAFPAPDPQLLKATTLGLAAVRQSIDQLGAQLVANQRQMASEIAKLQATDQDILQKITPPPQAAAAAPRPPARKPVSLTPPPAPSAAAH